MWPQLAAYEDRVAGVERVALTSELVGPTVGVGVLPGVVLEDDPGVFLIGGARLNILCSVGRTVLAYDDDGFIIVGPSGAVVGMLLKPISDTSWAEGWFRLRGFDPLVP